MSGSRRCRCRDRVPATVPEIRRRQARIESVTSAQCALQSVTVVVENSLAISGTPVEISDSRSIQRRTACLVGLQGQVQPKRRPQQQCHKNDGGKQQERLPCRHLPQPIVNAGAARRSRPHAVMPFIKPSIRLHGPPMRLRTNAPLPACLQALIAERKWRGAQDNRPSPSSNDSVSGRSPLAT